MDFKELDKKKVYRYAAVAILACFALFFCIVLFLFVGVRYEWITDLPDQKKLKTIKIAEASSLLDVRGKLISKYYFQNRENLNFEDINPYFLEALIATEDERFFKHNGVDLIALFRVAIKTILLRSNSGGGSTITQQLIKHTFPREEFRFFSTIINKFREMVLARRLERIYSKEEILTHYTNTVSFGEQAFGLEVASNRFFNKDSKELTLADAACLVGILKAPSYYSPRRFPERARRRRNIVLNQLCKNQKLEESVYDSIANLPLAIDYNRSDQIRGSEQYFKQYIVQEFKAIMDTLDSVQEYNLYKDGLVIHTSLDFGFQKSLESKFRSHMKKIQTLFYKDWNGNRLLKPSSKILKDYIRKSEYYNWCKSKGQSEEEIFESFQENGKRNLWTWDGNDQRECSRVDSIKHHVGLLHGGFLAMEPQTGKIKSWIGGIDYQQFQFDNVRSKRQVGSTFKPLVYLTALEQGVHPCQEFPNEKRNYIDYDDWTPRNADGEYGGNLTFYEALVKSVNTVSVQVLFKAGINKILDKCKKLGIESNIPEVPSIVLGTSDISLLEMVQAYGHFANGGKSVRINSIEKIEDKYGNVLFESKIAIGDSILDGNVVDVINSMLHTVNNKGTGRRLNKYKLQSKIAGKTGTTQNQSDGWYIAYTPDIVMGSWVGTMDRRFHFRTLAYGSGSNVALPIVGEAFKIAERRKMLKEHVGFIKYKIEDCPNYVSEEERLLVLRRDSILKQSGYKRRSGSSNSEQERVYIEADAKDPFEEALGVENPSVERRVPKRNFNTFLNNLFKKKKNRRRNR